MPDPSASIIDQLIEQRHLQGMTQKELAQAARLSQPVIARLESKKTSPQLDTLIRVAHALGCRLEVVRAAKD